MKKINRSLIIILLALSQFFVACEDWLDVQPAGDVDLEEHIKTADGYFKSLNGVYINMSGVNLYGHQLMYGAIETAAQNNFDNRRGPYDDFNWEDPKAKSLMEAIWKGLYNAIANNNVILDNIDANKDLFHEDDYNLIKGEALALRAFLHFDALRLFGEAYSEATASNVQIPYVLSFELARYPHLSMDKVYEQLLMDLDEAEKLLETSDPINPKNEGYDGQLFNTNKRKYSLNYFAVLALKARVCITKGDKELAKQFAERVIDEYTWSWVSQSDLISPSYENRDMLFSSELISCLNVQKLDDYHTDYFLGLSAGYTPFNGSANYAELIFEVTNPGFYWKWGMDWGNTPGKGGNDYRYQYLMRTTEGTGDKLVMSIKYSQVRDGSIPGKLRYTAVPLLRVSEMVLIAAEACLGDGAVKDIPKARAYIEELWDNRGVIPEDLSGMNEQELMRIIEKEMRKETYLEGQAFYLFKRLGLTKIDPAINNNLAIDVDPASYVVPLPDSELEFGNR